MKIEADGFSFDFTDAVGVMVFDEKDKNKPNYHGVHMKAVDIVVELTNAYLYVEMKKFPDPELPDALVAANDEEVKSRRDHFKWLKNYLKYKYRDSYLYRHAEEKVDKPIHYICLLTLENAQNVAMRKALVRELPVGKASRRWQREIVTSCQVVNLAKWNENFPKWLATEC